MLKKLDTDGSGGISKEEFAAAPKGDKAKGKEGMLDKMFEMRDTNKDGELDKAELSKGGPGGKGGGDKGGKGGGDKGGDKGGKGKGDKGGKDKGDKDAE